MKLYILLNMQMIFPLYFLFIEYKNQIDNVTLVKEEIDHFELWCQNHQMLINFEKSKVLNVNLSRTPVS